MNKRIISFILGATFLFLTTILQAQPRQDEMLNRRIEMMKNRLSLTDEQTEKVKEILLNERKTMMEEREKNAGDREAMMKARREALDRTDKEIEAILTPEQKEKYQVLKKEIREQRQSRMRRGR